MVFYQIYDIYNFNILFFSEGITTLQKSLFLQTF